MHILLECIYAILFPNSAELVQRPANRFFQEIKSRQVQYGTFRIYTIYAAGSTVSKLNERYEYPLSESFFKTILQNIPTLQDPHSVQYIKDMKLLVLSNFRSLSNSGIWYMTGLALRACLDLSLHGGPLQNFAPCKSKLRQRLILDSIVF